jgi:hypothetical protein
MVEKTESTGAPPGILIVEDRKMICRTFAASLPQIL